MEEEPYTLSLCWWASLVTSFLGAEAQRALEFPPGSQQPYRTASRTYTDLYRKMSGRPKSALPRGLSYHRQETSNDICRYIILIIWKKTLFHFTHFSANVCREKEKKMVTYKTRTENKHKHALSQKRFWLGILIKDVINRWWNSYIGEFSTVQVTVGHVFMK